MRSDWPLAGRSGERQAALSAVFGNESGGAVIAGLPGVGKTRLAAEVVDEGRRLGYDIELQVATKSAASVPFGLFAHLASGSKRFASLAEMLVRLSDAIAARAEARPTLIAVDDCHLVDEGTAAFLHGVAAEGKVKLLLTARTSEPAPDAIKSLWKDGHLARVDLRPLDETAIDWLAQEALGGQVETATRHRLRRLSAGNPLFLRELLLAGVQHGFLRENMGIWCWHGHPVVSERLDELIGDRLAGASPIERQIIDRLAVAEVLPIELIGDGARTAALDGLEDRRVVKSTVASGRIEVRLDHPLYGEAVQARMSLGARHRIMAEIAGQLMALTDATDDDRFRAAVWRMEADAEIDAAADLEAAQHALAASEYDLAQCLADRAERGGAGAPAQLVTGHALYWMDRHEAVEASLRNLAPDASDSEVAEAAIIRSSARFWGLDDVVGSTDLLADAVQTVTDPASRARVNAHLASLLLWSGTPPSGDALATMMLSGASTDSIGRLRATVPAALSAAVDGRRAQTVLIVSGAMDEAIAHTHLLPQLVGELLAVQATAEWLGGDLQPAASLALQVSQWSADRRAEDLLGIFTLISGQILADQGQLEPAVAKLREATVVLADRDPGRVAAWAWAALANALGQRGEADAATVAAVEAGRTARAATQLLDPLVARATAWAAAAEGVESAGAATVLAAVDAIGDRGMRAVEVLLLTDALRLGGAKCAVERLAVLAAETELPHALAAHLMATGLADRHAPHLDSASVMFEARGALLVAAEAAATAAQIYREEGRRSPAAACAERFRCLSKACPGARTPILVAASNSLTWTLTDREREISTMAAGGLASRAIAARLGLSERTVENHLARSYSKTGVNNRAALAEILSIAP